MKKLIILSIVVGGYIFAGIQGDTDHSNNNLNVEKYFWVEDFGDDNLKAEAGRRRGKHGRGKRRGGGGLR